MSANGVDLNGTFIVKGLITLDMLFSAIKLYPDHCVHLWGNANLDESKLMMLDWNSPPPL